jgi:hypothetical protein
MPVRSGPSGSSTLLPQEAECQSEHCFEHGDGDECTSVIGGMPNRWYDNILGPTHQQMLRLERENVEVLSAFDMGHPHYALMTYRCIFLLPKPLDETIDLRGIISAEDLAVARDVCASYPFEERMAELLLGIHYIRLARDMTPLEIAIGLQPPLRANEIQLSVDSHPVSLPTTLLVAELQHDYRVNAQAIRDSRTLTEIEMGKLLECLKPALLMLYLSEDYHPGGGMILTAQTILEGGAAILHEYKAAHVKDSKDHGGEDQPIRRLEAIISLMKLAQRANVKKDERSHAGETRPKNQDTEKNEKEKGKKRDGVHSEKARSERLRRILSKNVYV